MEALRCTNIEVNLTRTSKGSAIFEFVFSFPTLLANVTQNAVEKEGIRESDSEDLQALARYGNEPLNFTVFT